MMKFQIKVCGITRTADAELVAKLGGDMIGMIFYRRSPRFVTQRCAATICQMLPSTVDRVGLFVDEETGRIIRIADRLQLDYVQLHGGEPASAIKRLQRHGLKVIKAFAIKSKEDYRAVHKCTADLILLDNCSVGKKGGTGATFDWSVKPGRSIPNLVLAGGITADNVEDGVNRFSPLVVDVNSGVETSPGLKSKAALSKFFKQCDRLRYGK